MRTTACWLVALACGCRTAPPEGAVTLESLLVEMTDHTAVARLPEPAYACRQASSYDRDSVAAEEAGWFANWDRSEFVRSEPREGRTEHVMLDAEGPGAIVRFWGTWHGPRDADFSNGTLRVYLDRDPEPVIEGPIRDVLSGGALVGPPLSQYVSKTCPEGNRAHNSYLPIPYAEHCEITYETPAPIDRGARDGGEALYYQINYRTYAEGTPVESYSPAVLRRAKRAVKRAQAELTSPTAALDEGYSNYALNEELAPGSSAELDMDGPAAIAHLTLSIEAEDRDQAARSTVLEIAFDGERTVWAPFEAFFGCGPRLDPYRTWYVDVDAAGTMRSRWVMPFRGEARVTLHNLGVQPVAVRGHVATRPWTWDERSMYFHATWNPRFLVETGASRNETPLAEDAAYVHVEGRGVYVGDALDVFNGARAWWGEGDEKIRVDGEAFPSHFGTGTEDYYGYAWCRPEPFEAPFHAQPRGEGNFEPGASVNVRYRSLDAIPFERSLAFDMEIWHWAETRMNFAPTSLWYARPGAVANVAPDPEAARRPIAREREDVVEIFRVPGAIEGEDMTVTPGHKGVVEMQEITSLDWSGDQQIWWRDAAVGSELELSFPVERSGRYRVIANLTQAVDYGIFRLHLGGDELGVECDLYSPDLTTVELDLGEHELEAGEVRLRVVLTGRNPGAVDRRMFGLDHLRLERLR